MTRSPALIRRFSGRRQQSHKIAQLSLDFPSTASMCGAMTRHPMSPEMAHIAIARMCELVPVNGTLVAVGPVELDVDDTTYQYVVIRQEDGTVRDFAAVQAIPEVSGLVERGAGGIFLFWDGPNGCRLSFFYRDDGARAVDFDAMREFLETLGEPPKGSKV